MKKNNLFICAILLFISMVVFSCKKTATNALTGNWKLTGVHSRVITSGNNLPDTLYYDSTYNPALSQILEFNGDNTYSVTDYSQTPPVVTYGKYTFTGASVGTMIMTPNLTIDNLTPVAANSTYIITPSNSFSNSTLVLISSTTTQGSVESDSTYYIYF